MVHRTSSGKSLVFFLSAGSVGGITQVLVSIPSLTRNQLSKFITVDQRPGTVTTVHLDETALSNLVSQVIPKMESMANHKSETLVLRPSHQHIADTPAFSLPFSSTEINKHCAS